jgi:YVTN family beta-propeller protein
MPASNLAAVIDGSTQRTTPVAVGKAPSAVAVNALTNTIYVANAGDGTLSVVDGFTNQVTPLAVGTSPTLIAVNPITNHILVANAGNNSLTLVNGYTNATSSVNLSATPVALTLNLATNHLYVTSANGMVTVVDGITTASSNFSVGTSAGAVDVDPTLGQVYITNPGGTTLTSATEQRLQSVPLNAGTTGLPQAQTIPHSVAFTVTAVSTYQPTAPPVLAVYYQIDSWQGSWLVAQGSGNTFTASTANLASGTHVLYTLAVDGQVATSTGIANSSVGTINAYVFTVVEGQSSVTLASSANPSESGQSVTITAAAAAVSPAIGIPTGMMTFMDGATVLARDIPVNANGQASFTTSGLPTAAHSIQAFYSGDANVMGSASTAFGQSVNRGNTKALLAVTPNSAAFGQAVLLTAMLSAVSPASWLPTGTVQFMDGAKPIGSPVALNGGKAGLTTTSLSTGSHSLMVSYSGDVNFGAINSGVVNELVGPAVLSLSAAPSSLTIIQGQAGTDTLHVTTQGTLAGPVTFACSGLPGLSQCSFSPSSVPANSVPAKVSVTITTSGSQMASVLPPGESPAGQPFPWSNLALVSLALPAAVLFSRSRRQGGAISSNGAVLIVTTLALILSLVGCGGSSSNSGGTPAGTYKVMVTASSGSLQGSTPINVTITQ